MGTWSLRRHGPEGIHEQRKGDRMYKRTEQGWLKHLDFILLDVLCLQLALVLACCIRYGPDQWLYDEALYRRLALWMSVFDVIVAVMFNTMRNVLKRSASAELRYTLAHSALVFGAVVLFLFSTKEAVEYSRQVLWTTLFGYCAIAFIGRMLWKKLMRRWLRDERKRAMLLIASEKTAREAIGNFRAHPLAGIGLSGLVLTDRDAAGETFEGVPVVAGLSDAAQYICREWIDEVYIGVADMNERTARLLDKCREMGVTIHLWTMSLSGGKQTVEEIAGMTVVSRSINMASPMELLLKRVVDLLGGVVLSLLALIAIAVFGPMIKRRSPGPVLYAKERIGQNGRKFRMYKIRSMDVGADERKASLMDQNLMSDERMFKMEFDPRIVGNRVLPDGTHKTGVGDFIRRYSIDELPQAFNLLLGNMSLVGTRPPTVDEWEKYELHHRARLAIKPGITGMWQVQGRNRITNFEEITRLDTYYIAHWSFLLDMKILFKTVWVVLQRKGAM